VNLWRIILDVLRPGSPEFHAQLSLLDEHQARLTRALHLLEQPVTRDMKAAADSAAEFR
jgi:hypothetical protein